MKSLETTLETVGSVLGVAGALLIATNTDISKWGFVLFFMSAFAFMGMAFLKHMHMFLMNQVVFQVINILGIYRWFF